MHITLSKKEPLRNRSGVFALKRLKIILQSKYIFKVLVIITLFVDLLVTNLYTFKSKYKLEDTEFIGIVTKYELQENKLVLQIKAKEKLIIKYKYDDKIFTGLSYGDKLLVKGILKEPSVINIPNTFNYKKYLYPILIEIIRQMKVGNS